VRIGITKDRRFAMRVGLDQSGIKSSSDLAFRDVSTLNQASFPAPVVTVHQDVTDDSASDFVTLLDAELALEARIGKRARVGLGYRHATWKNALVNQRFPSAVNLAQEEVHQENFELGGPYLRVAFFF
jgi:hypothetical protein